MSDFHATDEVDIQLTLVFLFTDTVKRGSLHGEYESASYSNMEIVTLSKATWPNEDEDIYR